MSKVKPDSIFMLVDKVNAIQKLFHRTSIKLDLMMLEKMGKKSCSGGGSTFITVNNVQTDVLIASGSGGGSGYYEIENPGGYGGYIGENAPDLKFFIITQREESKIEEARKVIFRIMRLHVIHHLEDF